MKRRVFIVALLLISVCAFIVNDYSFNRKEMDVRNIYIENNDFDLSYLDDKYNIFDTENNSIEILETYSSSMDKISNTSLEGEYKIDYIVCINKNEQYFTFSYKLYEDGELTLTSFVNINIFEYENEHYFSSSNGYIIPCNEICDTSNLGQCASFSYAFYDDCLGLNLLNNRFGFIGGGGAALGTALGMAAGIALIDTTINSSNSGSISGVGGSSSSNSNSNTAEEKLLNKAADIALANEEENYGWNRESLKAALGLSLNLVVNGELTKVDKIKKEKFTVYLGKYISNSELSYENVAKNEEGSVVFSMTQETWQTLANEYSEQGMWILNKFFLAYCISKDCDFVLTTAPDPYCINGIPQTTSAYSKELAYIYSRGYIWQIGAPAYTRVSK